MIQLKLRVSRLLLSGILPAQKAQELTKVAQALDPIHLFQQLEQLQQAVFRYAVGCSPFVSSPLSSLLQVFTVEKCTAGKLPAERSAPSPNAWLEALCREQERRKRVLGWRRTHKDAFEGEWEQILLWLVANPERAFTRVAVTSSGNCSAAPPNAINPCKSAPSNEACGKSEPICCKLLRNNGKRK